MPANVSVALSYPGVPPHPSPSPAPGNPSPRECAAVRYLPAPCSASWATVVVLLLSGLLPSPPLAAQDAGGPPSGLQGFSGAPAWNSTLEAFGRSLARDVAADDMGGIVAGVAVDGDLVWAGAFGWADRDRRIPMGTAMVSRTGSISKPVTAMLLLRFVDRGVVALDDPVVRHLPELQGLDDPDGHLEAVTFRLLASHQAGLIREPRLQGAAAGPIEGWEAQILRSIPATGFALPPGTETRYSNIGYGILGLALSRAAGRPFVDLVEEEIFRTLGMTGSTFVVGDDLAPRLAAGYLRNPEGVVDGSTPAREHAGRGYKVPNGGVYSTVADLARFAGAASGTPGLRILSEESRRELIRIQPPAGPERGYGIGFSVQMEEGGRRIASHGGAVAGYTAHMAFDPDAGISVVLLRNYGGGATNLGGVATTLLRELVATPPRPSVPEARGRGPHR
jgi:CubicO group peptidase (beta-lactamase class C family)